MRKKVCEEQGLFMNSESGGAPARNATQHAMICGSPATVAEEIAKIDDCGVGGLILAFRIGPIDYDTAANSIRLFMEKVAPEFKEKKAA